MTPDPSRAGRLLPALPSHVRPLRGVPLRGGRPRAQRADDGLQHDGALLLHPGRHPRLRHLQGAAMRSSCINVTSFVLVANTE